MSGGDETKTRRTAGYSILRYCTKPCVAVTGSLTMAAIRRRFVAQF